MFAARFYYEPSDIFCSPQRFAAGAFARNGIEAELAFTLARDLPPQKWSYTEVERKRGRWFIASDGASDADVVTIQLAGAIAEVYLAEPYEKAAEIIESSKTLDEARAALAARKKPFDALLTGQNPNGKR